MENVKRSLGELIFQIIPVMIGVYLGFVISNWSESQNKRKESNVLVQSIQKEIENNSQTIKNVLDYHTMLRDSCSFYSNHNSPIKNLNFFEGVRIKKLAESAYQTGLQTGIINNLDIERIQKLNALYTSQESFNEMANMILTGLINRDFSSNESSIKSIMQFLAIAMTDVVIQENNLMENYIQMKEDLQD